MRNRWRLGIVAGVVWAVGGWSLAAPVYREMPAGIDEKEYERLQRPGAWREVPDFLSPEAMAGLSDKVAEAIQQDFAERGRIQVQSDRFLDFDENRNMIYSNARTRIRVEQFMLEADRVLVHVPLQEIQAEGNVILRAWADPGLTIKTDEVRCESLLFNYKYFQGAAYKVRGQHDYLYFKAETGQDELPAFRMVGRDEVIFRDVEFTTCDFPHPQYYVSSKDAVLVFDDRIFLSNAWLYVRGIPVLWLPAYTRSLRERSPWNITFGRASHLGTYVNLRYNFYHYRYEPSMEDEDELELRNRTHARLKLDLFSRRGVGTGLEYNYNFDFGKHRGLFEVYGLPSDRERNVEGDDNSNRWQLYGLHRSQLRDDLVLHLGVDYMSDPEFYYDLYDPLVIRNLERGRVAERRARGALTYWKNDFIGRVLVDVRERVTRDRITNTSQPGDDDFDYDPTPDDPDLDFHDKLGLSPDRYGLVSLRLPQLQFSTSHIRVGGDSPLFYWLDVNAFNNLDKGLNFQDSGDDSFVLGVDIYQQLSYLFRFSERYTLLAQIGAGLGAMQRMDDSYGWEPEDFVRSDGKLRSDIEFVDHDTLRVTSTGEEISSSDYQPGFVYGDVKLRFQGRFTDSLTGNIYYIFREGTDNSLGEFYESIGNRTARTDLYDYRVRKHWLQADLRYHLLQPNLTFSLAGGRNLRSTSELYPNEKIQYVHATVTYGNQARTLTLQGSVGYDQYQIRDPEDPNQFQRDSILVGARAAYAPIHHRWWIEGDVGYWKPLNSDPQKIDPEVRKRLEDYYREVYGDDRFDFRENQSRMDVEGWVGRKIGEKYTLEVGAEYDQYYNGLRDFEAILTRDLHNALALLRFRYWQRPWYETKYDYDVSFSVTFKLPGPMDIVQAPRSRVLIEQQRKMMLAEGDPFL